MLALVVIYRLYPRQTLLRPSRSVFVLPILPACRSCFALFAPYRPLCFQSLPTIKFCNPFVLITIQIAGGCTSLCGNWVDGVGILRRGGCAMPNFFEYNPEQ